MAGPADPNVEKWHPRARRGTRSRMKDRPAIAIVLALVLALVLVVAGALGAGCGGARTRVIDGHEMTFEGERESARLSVDGVPVRVTYDRVAGAYRAPGCDFGPAATLESLAEQVATTSPGTCEPLQPASP